MQLRGHTAMAFGGLLAALPSLPAGAVLVTFSGLNNGVNNATDPENTSTGNAIPTTYQPLQNAYPAPGGAFDGGTLGVNVTWANSFVAAKASNNNVNEHTHLVTPADTSQVNLYDNGTNPITWTFSQPVTIPSFFYAFFAAGTYSGSFSAFTNASDTTPVATYSFPSAATTSYAWVEETRFGNTPLQKITFSRSAQYLQIDDATINLAPVPEPTGAAIVAAGVAALASRRRRRSAAR